MKSIRFKAAIVDRKVVKTVRVKIPCCSTTGSAGKAEATSGSNLARNDESVRENESVKKLFVEFLYLDLNTCKRCMASDSTLLDALRELSGVLDTLGYTVTLNKIQITSPELAEEYGFMSSPTIRINGSDICADVVENNCRDCGDICGSDVDCRVFVYEGVEYEQPPKAMIIDGILKVLYSRQNGSKRAEYKLPENLRKFYDSRDMDNGESCCGKGCGC